MFSNVSTDSAAIHRKHLTVFAPPSCSCIFYLILRVCTNILQLYVMLTVCYIPNNINTKGSADRQALPVRVASAQMYARPFALWSAPIIRTAAYFTITVFGTLNHVMLQH